MKGHVKNKRQLYSWLRELFTVPTIWFEVLFAFVVVAHDCRRVLHLNVTAHPAAVWAAQQKWARDLAVPQSSARRLDATSLGSHKGGHATAREIPRLLARRAP